MYRSNKPTLGFPHASKHFIPAPFPAFYTTLIMAPCDPSSAFFGFMSVTSAIFFANLGAAYGTAKSAVGISSMGVMRPDMVMRSIIPVVMAGVLGIYGLITAGIINGKIDKP